MKLRSCVVMPSAERTTEISEEKSYSVKVADKKDNLLNKKYNLRVHGKTDSEKKILNHNSLNDLKKSDKKNGNEINTDNYEKKSAIHEKENKIKKRSKRQVVRQNDSLKIRSCASLSPVNFQDKFKCTFEEKNKITGILNMSKKSSGKMCVSSKREIKCNKTNVKVPLSEISNGNSETHSHLENVFDDKLGARRENIVNHTGTVPIWRKKLNENKPKRSTKRKSFVDIYDISQDEDIMSSETNRKRKKINSQKNVKRCVNKNECHTISNKNVNFNKKYSFNTLKPVQKRPKKLETKHQLDVINSNPATMETDTNFLLDKISDVKIASDIVDEGRQNYITSNPSAVKVNTTTVLSDKSNVIPNLVDENGQNCLFSTPVEVDDINIISDQRDFDDVLSKSKLQDDKNFLETLADELEKSLLLPRMTSTPDSTLLIKPGTKPLGGKMMVLDISHIVSKVKNPKDIKSVKLSVKTHDPVPVKKADISLFESPVKKPQKKELVKFKSPKKNVHINLITKFTEPPTADNLDDSVLKPKKAYHSPDNFKSHLARTKRISEVMKKETNKSKNDMMIEKMVQHFDDISGTELCIE